MSLFKLIVIVLVVGALGLTIYGFMMGGLGVDKGGIEKTMKKMEHIKAQASKYFEETGSEPTRLSLLVAKKYLLEAEAVDSWGTELVYKAPVDKPAEGETKSSVFILTSAGPDTFFDTQDDIKFNFDLVTSVAE